LSRTIDFVMGNSWQTFILY